MKFFLYPFLFLISLNSFSSTYYVAPSASGGDDDNAGTFAAPFETITHALTQLSAGDILYIREGTYRETITITQDGSSGNVITYGYLCNQTRVRTKSTSEKLIIH